MTTGGGASGATHSDDGASLGQRETRVSVVRDEGKAQGRPVVLHHRWRASIADNVLAAEGLTATAQAREWRVLGGFGIKPFVYQK
jgi:hypothetical protein